jgi:probable F420-dependent oxidoreductase
MRVGVVFPQTEIGSDPAVIRDFARTAEDLGYHHILAYDHVVGADPAQRPGWRPPYTYLDTFHEPFVLFAFLAGVTSKVQFTTGVIILPQRQTVLVAKQAAALDILSNGRLRLGIGIGWNPVEYEALGMNFQDRGLRSEEQVHIMRELWTRELVTFHGRWHSITDAGIKPLPVQKPIPVWFGGSHERLLRRAGRLADGWFPLLGPDEKCRGMIERLRDYVRNAGRDPAALGVEGRITLGPEADGRNAPQRWLDELEAWKSLGASHVCLNTMKAGLAGAAHIGALRRFQEATATHW